MSDKKPEAKPADGAPAASGGIKPMLPLILNVVLMPVMAYVMTVYVLLPKMKKGLAVQAKTEAVTEGEHGAEASAESEKGEKPSGGGETKEAEGEKGGGKGGGKGAGVPLSGKVLVNVSGTAGTRYLLTSLTLIGKAANLKELVDGHDAQLHDVAASVLANKTIADLDKPGARNLIRTELISAFNNVLGEGKVKEIYFTEFAIQ